MGSGSAAVIPSMRGEFRRGEQTRARLGSDETASTSDTTDSSTGGRRGGRNKDKARVPAPSTTSRRRRFQSKRELSTRHLESAVPHQPPRGLLNLGNTCYANAALQCLMSTALSHALLDPKNAIIFRRYASNVNLLSLGSGSADTDDDDDEFFMTDPTLTPTPSDVDRELAEQKRRREERQTRSAHRDKEKEKFVQRELCRWLSGEMTDITRAYTAEPAPKPPEPSRGLFSWFSAPPPPIVDAVDPGSITRNVHKMSKTLRPYQQEDAHEFLRALLSGLVMDGQNRHLSALFDGLLESAVTCQTCRYASLTRDRYMDLSLDIADESVYDLVGALRKFTKTECLDADNMVVCGRCKEKRIVKKGLRLATAPTVLVCHLKRFAMDPYGRTVRLNKEVEYPQHLEIGEFMSRANRSTPPPYELVGVLVHSGRTCDSGHYLAYIKSGSKWYKANDAIVSEVPASVALGQKAYILIYEVAGMRERHGCSTFRRYHRKLPRSSLNSEESRHSNSRPHSSSVDGPSRRNRRSHSAPRPHGEGRNNEEVNNSGVRTRGGSKSEGGESLSHDCFTSLFGLLDLCGTAEQVDDIHSKPSGVTVGRSDGLFVPGENSNIALDVLMADDDDISDNDLDASNHVAIGYSIDSGSCSSDDKEYLTGVNDIGTSTLSDPTNRTKPRNNGSNESFNSTVEDTSGTSVASGEVEDESPKAGLPIKPLGYKRSTSSGSLKDIEQKAVMAYRTKRPRFGSSQVAGESDHRKSSSLNRYRTGSESDTRFLSYSEHNCAHSTFSETGAESIVSELLTRHQRARSIVSKTVLKNAAAKTKGTFVRRHNENYTSPKLRRPGMPPRPTDK